MLLAGDEIGNSQGGNNNAYAQDNEVGWVDWTAPDLDLLAAVRRFVTVRRDMPVLRQTAFRHGQVRADGHPDVRWHRADGTPPTQEDWHDPAWRTVAAELRGAAGDPAGEDLTDVALVVVNLGPDAEVTLPPGHDWQVRLDSAREHTDAIYGAAYPALEQSVVVLSSGVTEPG